MRLDPATKDFLSAAPGVVLSFVVAIVDQVEQSSVSFSSCSSRRRPLRRRSRRCKEEPMRFECRLRVRRCRRSRDASVKNDVRCAWTRSRRESGDDRLTIFTNGDFLSESPLHVRDNRFFEFFRPSWTNRDVIPATKGDSVTVLSYRLSLR